MSTEINMEKWQEKRNTDSCFNKANSHETIFVLLGRDPAAPATIRFWIHERMRLKLNLPPDSQLFDADECASTMELDGDASTRDLHDILDDI